MLGLMYVKMNANEL